MGTIPSGADDDDTSGTPDDEDGVVFPSPIVASASAASTASVDVNLQNPDATSNRLDGWIDFNRDGDWNDPGEQIFSSFNLGTSAGVQNLSFAVPQDTGSNIDLDPRTVTYSWTGFAEDNGANPWGLSGDGSLSTLTDGTPFSVEVVVSDDAPDVYAGNTSNLAGFYPVSATFTIFGVESTPRECFISFQDDASGFDRVSFRGDVTVAGITQQISARRPDRRYLLRSS